MSDKKTEIVLVLGRSGSMQSIREDVIGGLNVFVEEQRKGDGECRLSVIQFDDQFEEMMRSKAVSDVPEWTLETFVPRGSTALLDAIHRGAGMLEELMADGSLGLLVVMTDGMENCSREATKDEVMQRLESLKRNGAGVIYLGANQDAIHEGGSLGVNSATAATYKADSAGTRGGVAYASRAASSFRSTGGDVMSLAATDQERVTMAGGGSTGTSTILNTAQAAAALGIGESTLRRMRSQGEGPRHVKPSPGAVRYRRQDLDEFLKGSASK